MIVATAALSSTATTRTYCGVRSGTAGNAYLDATREADSLTLAEQGQPSTLLDEIDTLVGPHGGETGTQNGTRYCAVVQLDSKGQPVKVIKAWRPSKKK